MRYFFHISYIGTRYHGWQRQPNVPSVQETIEECLEQVLHRKTIIIGCGRTDAGVHARQYFFHLDSKEELPQDTLFKCNKTLPQDIVIHEIFLATDRPHAQWAATERTYDYFIHTRKDPLLGHLSTLYELEKLDRLAMQSAVNVLKNYTDFRALCKSPDRHKDTICHVFDAQLWFSPQDEYIRFQIRASRFLKAMIRIIVAQLIDIGQGRQSVADFEERLAQGQAGSNLNQAYPQGLYLSKVSYPSIDLAPQGTGFFWWKEEWEK